MFKFSSLLLSAFLLGFQLTGLEKVFELKGPLDMTGVKKVIPVHPEFNFTPDQSFTVELKYRQDAPNPDKAYSSSILACGFWRMKAANKFGTPIFNASGRENVRLAAEKLQEMGAENVLVSMAGDGSLLLDENGECHRLGVPKGTVKNSVGAGDSMVAGFIAGWLQTGDFGYAQRLGTAAGSATAFSDGLAAKEQVQALLDKF